MKKLHRNLALLVAMNSEGLTSKALADQSGLTTHTISRILNRHSDPKPPTIRAICKVLGKTPPELGLIGGGDNE